MRCTGCIGCDLTGRAGGAWDLPSGEWAMRPEWGMVEVFLVTRGTLTAVVDEATETLPVGAMLVVEPNEQHELRNDTNEEAVVTYFSLPSERP